MTPLPPTHPSLLRPLPGGLLDLAHPGLVPGPAPAHPLHPRHAVTHITPSTPSKFYVSPITTNLALNRLKIVKAAASELRSIHSTTITPDMARNRPYTFVVRYSFC